MDTANGLFGAYRSSFPDKEVCPIALPDSVNLEKSGLLFYQMTSPPFFSKNCQRPNLI